MHDAKLCNRATGQRCIDRAPPASAMPWDRELQRPRLRPLRVDCGGDCGLFGKARRQDRHTDAAIACDIVRIVVVVVIAGPAIRRIVQRITEQCFRPRTEFAETGIRGSSRMPAWPSFWSRRSDNLLCSLAGDDDRAKWTSRSGPTQAATSKRPRRARSPKTNPSLAGTTTASRRGPCSAEKVQIQLEEAEFSESAFPDRTHIWCAFRPTSRCRQWVRGRPFRMPQI